MKKYLLFGGANYESAGGWNDFILDSDSIDELQQMIIVNNLHDEYMWYHIIDRDTKEIIEG